MPFDVLYIHQDGSLTGSAISLRNLLLAVDREEIHPRVLLAADGKARDLYESLGVPVDVIPMRFYGTVPGAHWFEATFYLNWLALFPNPRLAGYLREKKPDIVHINDKAMLAAGHVAAKMGFPVVWHLRSSYNISHSKFQAWVSKQIIRHTATQLVAISEDECDGFDGLNNLHVIYNSVDFEVAETAIKLRQPTRSSLGIGHDEIVIGMVGQLSKIRGAWDFIEIAGLVRKKLPNAKLRFVILAHIPSREHRTLGWRERLGIVDASHPEDKARRLAQNAGIADCLLITGYRSDALSVIAAMDIYVSCNHYGAMGRPPFEAMAVGVPVAAWTGHSGKSRILVDHETALVVPRWDKLALAEVVVRLASDQELRSSMGRRGREYSRQNFDPYHNADMVQSIYHQILRKEKGL